MPRQSWKAPMSWITSVAISRPSAMVSKLLPASSACKSTPKTYGQKTYEKIAPSRPTGLSHCGEFRFCPKHRRHIGQHAAAAQLHATAVERCQKRPCTFRSEERRVGK